MVNPGMVLDENGKPCKICTNWKDWSKLTKGSKSGGSKSNQGTTAATTAAAATATGVAATSVATTPTECPPDREALGRATWTFLHTTAAYYPLEATPAQQSNMRALLGSVGLLYPCTPCATDFTERMQAVEPVVSGRDALSQWLCDRHNEVNEKLGKPNFNCAKTLERWKDGPADGSCD